MPERATAQAVADNCFSFTEDRIGDRISRFLAPYSPQRATLDSSLECLVR